MQTICQLHSFNKAAASAGMSDEDIAGLIDYLASNPDAGEEMTGTGGCRKVRYAIEGNNKGKSGGVRTITLFSGENMPVFLLTVFGKSQRSNLSKAERNQLKVLSESIIKEYSKRVQDLNAGAIA